MDALRSQISIVGDELATLRAEIVQVKSAHATMHQGAVDTNAQVGQRFQQLQDRLETMATIGALISMKKISTLGC